LPEQSVPARVVVQHVGQRLIQNQQPIDATSPLIASSIRASESYSRLPRWMSRLLRWPSSGVSCGLSTFAMLAPYSARAA